MEELVAKNVAALVKLPPIRNRKGKSWSSEEARSFLEASRDDDDYLYAAYVLVLVLGLRKGEVLGLTWEHINWDGWQKPCTAHGEKFCEHCRDNHDINEPLLYFAAVQDQKWPPGRIRMASDLRRDGRIRTDHPLTPSSPVVQRHAHARLSRSLEA
ncbi:hypothetical protein HNR22_000052 [Micromonospora jinlongensis]|uniref:Tyr recombinase domain-containing protein n=1 Tax=Micromonospora jinlongensis TaxID=1287877 RepID=A0A7Y9WWV1_9ACTN|nr:hypothetical protein [Micromonospora jinlongensis]